MRATPSKSKSRNGIIAALDVGTTKVSCFIARHGDMGIEVLGVGHQVSHGVRGGVVVDMELAEAAVRAAVEAAEHMAKETVNQVVISLSAGHPRSRLVSFELGIGGHEIGEGDIRRVLDPQWLNDQQSSDRKLIHTVPISFSIDGNRGVRDPRGMFGERLGANLHLISVDASAAKNLATCVSRCHLNVENEVVSPYAAGLGCLIEDEIDLGCTLINMGGGSTGIAVFYEGELVHSASVPVGGGHVTNDIARGLSTTIAHAERVKTLYGSVLPSAEDDREVIKVPLVGEDDDGETNQVPRSMLVGIIRPRVEETFEMVKKRLQKSGLDRIAGRHVVLTGGAAQLTGARELAATMLDRQVRVGRPTGVAGLPEATSGAAFSVSVGLLRFVFEKPVELAAASIHQKEEPSGPVGRLGHWFREHF